MGRPEVMRLALRAPRHLRGQAQGHAGDDRCPQAAAPMRPLQIPARQVVETGDQFHDSESQTKSLLALLSAAMPAIPRRATLGATASRLFLPGWSRRVIRMQIVSVHPLGDEAIILMPDKNLRCMTALSVLFGQFYCCTKCLRFAWEN
jgi:hypothetical protein